MNSVNLFLIFFVTLFSIPIQAQSHSPPRQGRWHSADDTRVKPTQKIPSPPSQEEETDSNPPPSSSSQETKTDQASTFVPPPPPPGNRGAPSQRSHAGSRGCGEINKQSSSSSQKKPLTALVPVYETPNSRLSWGLTTAERPTFWFYVPYTLTPEHSIEFVLKDEQENYVYKTKFPGRGTPPGIVSFRLPSSISLKVAQDYDWYFLIYCHSSTPSSSVNGLIRRVERPELKSQLDSATPQERFLLYAHEGIWYEALRELAEFRHANPENKKLNDEWANLLQSVGLGHLAPEPLVRCCSAENQRLRANPRWVGII